jgi:leader peptidase (prepilin peptidase)/N-methyltransferase
VKGYGFRMVNCILMIVIGVMLLFAGIADIKSLSVSRRFIFIFLAICLVTVFTGQSPNLMSALLGTLVGICALGISIISDGQIGKGDCYVIAALGLVLGFRGSLVVVCISSMIMCIIAVIMLILKKGDKKTKLPFIPVLFASYAIFIINNFGNMGVAFI